MDWIRWEDEGLEVDGVGLDGVKVGLGSGFEFVLDFSSLGVRGLEFLLRSFKKGWWK